MKYAYNGAYREFMGRVFVNGNPVEITDKATMEAISKQPDFVKVEDEKVEETKTQTVLSDECPTCGKVVKRGKFMHQKYCK